MAVATKIVLQDLLALTQNNLRSAEHFQKASIDSLNWKQNSESWSVLECIEHLNRYGDFYIPEINDKISKAKHNRSETFNSNWLGSYFSKSVAYNDQLKKMKTFASMNPLNSDLDMQTLEKFIKQQHQIMALLERSKTVNLDKTKTAISITKLVKLRLGDTFRVLIHHNDRHIKQAEKTWKAAKNQ